MNRKFPNVRRVARLLKSLYGTPTLGNKRNPFDELIFILLSSKTTSANCQRAYSALKRRYPRFGDLTQSPLRGIQHTIRFAGLSRRKARLLRDTARQLKTLFGRVTLSPLKTMSTPEAERVLTLLPGVGIKSARCILMYSLDRDVFPVDSHCFRVATRVGWARGNLWTRETADTLQEGIPRELRRSIHIGMILVGRDFCRPRIQKCWDCPLLAVCNHGQSHWGSTSRPSSI